MQKMAKKGTCTTSRLADIQDIFQRSIQRLENWTKANRRKSVWIGKRSTPPAQSYESETIKAIANLATATASDCATTARLTKTNTRLTDELKSTQQKLIKALEKIAQLSANRSPFAPCTAKAGKENQTYPPDCYYCCTHGYLSKHTSGRCPAPTTGHQKYATARKLAGGSTINQNEWLKHVSHIEK